MDDKMYSDYVNISDFGFETVIHEVNVAQAKIVNDLLISWGFDSEDCFQETFTFYVD